MSAPYDAVIVGGGVVGALTAKILSEAGKRVLILEAGIEGAMKPANYEAYLQEYFVRGGARGMPNGPYPANVAAPSPGMPWGPDYYAYDTPFHFASDYLRMLGGTTLHWQGSSIRLVPNDFRMQTVYGQGRDWPIAYDDLEPAYRRAEYELGVAADVEDQRFHGVWFADGYVYPMHRMPQSVVDQFFDQAVRGKSVALYGGRYPLQVISIPQGRNSTPNPRYDNGRGYRPASMVGDRDEGQRCQGNSACLPMCPVQAKYSALRTLDDMRRNRRVEIRTQSVASRLVVDKETGRVTGVEYKRYEDAGSPKHTVEVAQGTLVVLAANAIENATLLLASGVGNRSGQVGRNLMDHPYLYAWGSAPSRVYPFRGPDTTSGIESLRDGNFRKKHAAFRASLANWGWSGEPGNQIGALLGQQVYGRRFRETLADRLTRMVKIGFMFELLPSATNRVSISEKLKDAMGNYRPLLSFTVDDYALAGLDAVMEKVWPTVVRLAGIRDESSYPPPSPYSGYQVVTTPAGKSYNIMGSGHIVGTHRMGSRASDSVVDTNMRSWDHPNLYVSGAGCQVTIGTANPTLTTAALAVRGAEAMLRALE